MLPFVLIQLHLSLVYLLALDALLNLCIIKRVLIAFGESVCRPAGGSLIIEYFDVQHRAKVIYVQEYQQQQKYKCLMMEVRNEKSC